MIYVASDLHGCYDKYINMIKGLNLSEDDTLYILGDITDRGKDGIKILFDMMMRPNIVPILGNHDYMAYSVLKKLNVEITAENYDAILDTDTIQIYQTWIFNGGEPTCKAFSALSCDEKRNILEYIEDFEIYEELTVSGSEFVLVHGGIADFSENKPMSEYSIDDFIWGRCDYAQTYFPDKYLITGHTPTFFIGEKYRGKIYKENNHIAIDCGASYGEALGCICLDTLEEFYF